MPRPLKHYKAYNPLYCRLLEQAEATGAVEYRLGSMEAARAMARDFYAFRLALTRIPDPDTPEDERQIQAELGNISMHILVMTKKRGEDYYALALEKLVTSTEWSRERDIAEGQRIEHEWQEQHRQREESSDADDQGT